MKVELGIYNRELRTTLRTGESYMERGNLTRYAVTWISRRPELRQPDADKATYVRRLLDEIERHPQEAAVPV